MQRLRGVEKAGGHPGAVECAGDFLGDMRRFAYAAEDQFPAGLHHRLHRLDHGDERGIERIRGGLEPAISRWMHSRPRAKRRLVVMGHFGFVWKRR